MMVRIKTHGGKTEMARRRRKGPDTRVDGQIQTQIRVDGKLKINVEWRTWDGLVFTGVIVLLKSKVFGRRKIKRPNRDRQTSVIYA